MKFSVIAAITVCNFPSNVVADYRHVGLLKSTNLFPEADFRVKADPSLQSSDADDNLGRVYGDSSGRTYGSAFVFPAFIQKMQDLTNMAVNVAKDAAFHQVQMLLMTQSSHRHVDGTREVDGGSIRLSPLKKSEATTAFYVQEASPGSYFETDDDEICIPFVEGSAVYFNGALPHQSILKSGAVKLLGPFQLSSLKSVGNCQGCSTDEDCANPAEPCCDIGSPCAPLSQNSCTSDPSACQTTPPPTPAPAPGKSGKATSTSVCPCGGVPACPLPSCACGGTFPTCNLCPDSCPCGGSPPSCDVCNGGGGGGGPYCPCGGDTAATPPFCNPCPQSACPLGGDPICPPCGTKSGKSTGSALTGSTIEHFASAPVPALTIEQLSAEVDEAVEEAVTHMMVDIEQMNIYEGEVNIYEYSDTNSDGEPDLVIESSGGI